ncbi:MAG: hypothetical protein QOD06_1095 [Candidatus Binatota bacterium]|jgi:hypothetical protein|nr:hypothetical protein [Candidatus Binatota bacterium]
MKRFRGIVMAAALGGMMLAAAPAGAKGPCAGDIDRLCRDAKGKKGDVTRCLKAHESELSGECKQRFTGRHERREKARSACKEDVSRFCKGVQKGTGGMKDCLERHQSELSGECRSQLTTLERHR